ncbi:MAG: tetratricopeptide repeat protein [bacterium]
MAIAERGRRSHFSLRLEQGLGRLVLGERQVADLFAVEEMQLALPEVPSRLDMSGGVERFRHQRARLERLVVFVDDQDLGRALRAALRGGPIADVEVRALDGDLVILGEIAGDLPAPFIARLRLEPASVADERALLVSVYQTRIFGPARLAAPLLAAELLRGLGLGARLVGPTAATVDPVDLLLYEICAELGWKAPDRRDVRLVETQCTAGRVRLVTARQTPGRVGPRGVGPALEASPGARRFLADYEAKSLYASTEALIADGQLDRAIAAYDRQLEVHPDHPFLVTRLLQLQVTQGVTSAGALADAAALARARLTRYPDDQDALCALGVVQQRQGHVEAAAETWARLADLAEKRGDAVEAAQARCAVAATLAERDAPAAVRALESALALRRRLPGALRMLADLQARTGDWAAALRTRERLLAREEDPAARRALLHQLGRLALDAAGDLDAAIGYFERALEQGPDDIDALLGLAAAQERAGRILPAVRTLDRAARLLQERGDHAGAADAMVRLGDLWRRDPAEGAATAALRYRQALMLVPGHPGALFGLAEAALADGDQARARNALEELLRVADEGRPGVDRHAVHLRLGEVLALPGGDPPLAVAWFQKALQGTPAQAEAALGALERLHAAAERWDDVARVLELAAARVADPVEKGARITRLAEVVHRRHGDEARAVALLEEAATLRRDDPAVLERLAAVHRDAGRHEALEAILARWCARVEAPERLADLYAERGDLLRQHLNRTDEAAAVYALALGCVGAHLDALEGLADIYRERERFGELVPLLERLAGVVPRDEAGRVWLELGRVQARILDRPRAAITSYEHARETRPADPEVLRPLADLLFGAGQAKAAVPHYLALHAVYEGEGYDEPAGPFLARVAEALDAAGKGDEALAFLRTAAEADPDRQAVYEQAQDIYLRRGDVAGIVDFFSAGLRAAMRPSVRRFLAKRAGRLLWRELRRPEEAAPLLDEVLRADPEDADVRRMRLEVATAVADWPRVAALLRAQLERAEPRERPALLLSLAKLAYTALERPDEGTQLALAALGEQPDYRPALTLLGERSYAAEDWQNARRAYAGLVEADGADPRPDDVYRLAVAERHLGEDDAARVRLARLHARGAASPDALDLLATLAIDAADADALAAVLDDRLALGEPAADRRALLRSAARLLTADARHRLRGVDCWSALHALLPEDDEAIAALRAVGVLPEPEPEPLPEQVAERALDDDELPLDDDDELPPLDMSRLAFDPSDAAAEAEAIEARLAGELTPAERARALLSLAELRRDRLHDPDGAVPAFEEVLDLAEPAGPEWSEALEALEDLHAIREDWPRLLALYDRREAAGGDPAEIDLLRASILRAAGRLDEAVEAAERAAPTSGRALDLFVSLLVEAGRPAEAAAALVDDLARLGAEDAGHRRWRAAELVAAADPAQALAWLAEAHADLGDPALCDAWVEAARAAGDRRALADALEAQADALRGGGGVDAIRRSNALAEAGRVAAELGETRRARRLFDASLAAWPDNVEVLDDLAALLDRIDDVAALVVVRGRQIEAALPGPHRGEMALALARLAITRLGDRATAERWLAVAADDLDGTPAAAQVARLRAAPGDAAGEGSAPPDGAGGGGTSATLIGPDARGADGGIRGGRAGDRRDPAAAARETLGADGGAGDRGARSLTDDDDRGARGLTDRGARDRDELGARDRDGLGARDRDARGARDLADRDRHPALDDDAFDSTGDDDDDFDGELADALDALDESDTDPGRDAPVDETRFARALDVTPADATPPDATPADATPADARASGPHPLVVTAPPAPADTAALPAPAWRGLADADEIIEALVAESERLKADPTAREEAARLLEDALGIAPRTVRAYVLLESLYATDRRWVELCGVIERHAAIIGARPERAALLLKRAQIADRALGDYAAAADAYERALTDPAGDAAVAVEATDALLALRPRRPDIERLRRLLDDRIDHAADDRVRAGLLALRGVLWQTRFGEPARAKADLERAIALDRRHGRAHLALGNLAMSRGDASTASVHFERALLDDAEARTLTRADVDEAFEGLTRALRLLGRTDEIPMLAEEILARHPRCRAARAVAGPDSVETSPLPAIDEQ